MLWARGLDYNSVAKILPFSSVDALAFQEIINWSNLYRKPWFSLYREFKDAVFVSWVKSSAVIYSDQQKMTQKYEVLPIKETKRDDSSPLLHSSTCDWWTALICKAFHTQLHRWNERKCIFRPSSASSTQLCSYMPSNFPSPLPGLPLVMALWNSNPATDLHIHELFKSRLGAVQPPNAECTYTCNSQRTYASWRFVHIQGYLKVIHLSVEKVTASFHARNKC